eukprot:11187129-Lingulodinium_polyedra.AAC.1
MQGSIVSAEMRQDLSLCYPGDFLRRADQAGREELPLSHVVKGWLGAYLPCCLPVFGRWLL